MSKLQNINFSKACYLQSLLKFNSKPCKANTEEIFAYTEYPRKREFRQSRKILSLKCDGTVVMPNVIQRALRKKKQKNAELEKCSCKCSRKPDEFYDLFLATSVLKSPEYEQLQNERKVNQKAAIEQRNIKSEGSETFKNAWTPSTKKTFKKENVDGKLFTNDDTFDCKDMTTENKMESGNREMSMAVERIKGKMNKQLKHEREQMNENNSVTELTKTFATKFFDFQTNDKGRDYVYAFENSLQ